MGFASFITSAVGGILILCPIVGVAAQGPSRSEWYLGGGIGSNWASDMNQEGWNRETTCYPTDGCFDADPVPELSGYRWHYDVAAAAGAVFEVSAGRFFDRTRLELSLRQRKNGLNQMFRSITEYDGTPLRERSGSSVVSTSQASIDHLTVRTLTLNAYYEFPETFGRISPYLGGGLGPAFVTVSGLHFSAEYEDTPGEAPAYDPPLSFYNSRPDADLSDTVLAGHLHAGVDYSLTDKTFMGLKLTYSMMGNIEASGRYSLHPFHERDPDLIHGKSTILLFKERCFLLTEESRYACQPSHRFLNHSSLTVTLSTISRLTPRPSSFSFSANASPSTRSIGGAPSRVASFMAAGVKVPVVIKSPLSDRPTIAPRKSRIAPADTDPRWNRWLGRGSTTAP